MSDSITITHNPDGSFTLPALTFVLADAPMPPAPPVEPPAPPVEPPPAAPPVEPPAAPPAPVAVSQTLTIDKDPTQLHVGDVITFTATLTMSDGTTAPATAMALNCYDGGTLQFAHSWGPTATMIGPGTAHIFNDNSGTRGTLTVTVLPGDAPTPPVAPPPPAPAPAPSPAPPSTPPAAPGTPDWSQYATSPLVYAAPPGADLTTFPQFTVDQTSILYHVEMGPDFSAASWDFGDGTHSTDGAANGRHVYAQPGTYTITGSVSHDVAGQPLDIELLTPVTVTVPTGWAS